MGAISWLVALFVGMALFQLVAIPALRLKKNDLADVLWGPAFPIAAGAALFSSGEPFGELGTRKIVILAMLTLWALRLFVHVGWRNLSHLDHEDARYANWRREWGDSAPLRSLFQVFTLQPLILFLFLLPSLAILLGPEQSFGELSGAGVAVWAIGISCEVIADEQLRRFKRDPANKGKLMTTGIWSWSRHPNYFGEITLWWGIWLMALETAGAWWTVVAPLGVTFLILKVSGVSMLEALMRSRPGFAQYAASVSPLVPVPPALYRRLRGRA